MEKTSHNQISCLKCFERVCINRTQSVQHLNDFLLQAQRFVDEHQEGHSRNWHHVTQTWKQHGTKGRAFLHVSHAINMHCFHVVVIIFPVVLYSMCYSLKGKIISFFFTEIYFLQIFSCLHTDMAVPYHPRSGS